jgi:hypothetical protein
MRSILMRQRRMWGGWVIGFVLYVGRRWSLLDLEPVRARAKQKQVKEMVKEKDKKKGKDLRWKKVDRMKLPKSSFVDMSSTSTV